jgi:hypothetical protein
MAVQQPSNFSVSRPSLLLCGNGVVYSLWDKKENSNSFLKSLLGVSPISSYRFSSQ